MLWILSQKHVRLSVKPVSIGMKLGTLSLQELHGRIPWKWQTITKNFLKMRKVYFHAVSFKKSERSIRCLCAIPGSIDVCWATLLETIQQYRWLPEAPLAATQWSGAWSQWTRCMEAGSRRAAQHTAHGFPMWGARLASLTSLSTEDMKQNREKHALIACVGWECKCNNMQEWETWSFFAYRYQVLLCCSPQPQTVFCNSVFYFGCTVSEHASEWFHSFAEFMQSFCTCCFSCFSFTKL